jgi:hypothetical protein
MRTQNRRPLSGVSLALILVTGGCGGAAVSPPADTPVFKPTRQVRLACESVEIRDDAPPDSREKIVSRPKITTLVGRTGTVTVETTPADGGAPRLVTFDLVANEVTGGFSLEGKAKLEAGGAVVASAEAPAQTPPMDHVSLRLAASPGLALELRCTAGDPPAELPAP